MRGDRPYTLLAHGAKEKFTPHARGSTLPTGSGIDAGSVYPACAGIDPIKETLAAMLNSLPRMRGDRPLYCAPYWATDMFTPHARGSTRLSNNLGLRHPVYPACAGIDPPVFWQGREWTSLPRMRGDRPR